MIHEFGLGTDEWPGLFDAVVYAHNHSHLPSLASRTPVEIATGIKSKSIADFPIISMDEAKRLQIQKVDQEAFARSVDEIRKHFQEAYFPKVVAIDTRRHRANAKTVVGPGVS